MIIAIIPFCTIGFEETNTIGYVNRLRNSLTCGQFLTRSFFIPQSKIDRLSIFIRLSNNDTGSIIIPLSIYRSLSNFNRGRN